MTILAVYTTLDSRDAARAMARTLVERRLAACAQISEIESFYRWDGAIQNESEFRLVLKTTANGYDALAAAIRALHSYTTPAIYAHVLEPVDTQYAQWIRECTAPKEPPTKDDAP